MNRGSTTDRGYGIAHQRARARVAPLVAAGRAVCSRCDEPVAPDAEWHLDHDDDDRSKYRGVSHALCNDSAGGRKAGARKRAAGAAMKAAVTRLQW